MELYRLNKFECPYLGEHLSKGLAECINPNCSAAYEYANKRFCRNLVIYHLTERQIIRALEKVEQKL
jgi:hypothetical protein